MSLDDRIGWLLLGCFIGFIAGYIVRSLKEIQTKLDEVDDIVKRKLDRDDAGFSKFPIVGDIALLLVIILTVWAALESQSATNRVNDQQSKIENVSQCNKVFLTKTIKALNERTTFTQSQAQANIDLQKSQAKFFTLAIHDPPFTKKQRVVAAHVYLDALNDFVSVTSKSADKAEEFPYPSSEDLADCLINNH